ncbi:hypothetical protein [Silvanigrella sp.]|jgi:hypothetical protein|uniref:hypothetical protein n=1 Tax=Silvanigrella sp. TaxID=2024976 RepID=UPI0037C4FE91|nr:hypothetical protein [Silvanigrellaceae bacterium]
MVLLNVGGDNASGQLGDGTTTVRSSGVSPVTGGTSFSFSCADFTSCSVSTANQLKCWGGILSVASPTLVSTSATFVSSGEGGHMASLLHLKQSNVLEIIQMVNWEMVPRENNSSNDFLGVAKSTTNSTTAIKILNRADP